MSTSRMSVSVSSKNMVGVLALSQELDIVTDLFRHRDLIVSIPFSEYVSFITYVLGDKQTLCEPSKKLREAVRDYTLSFNKEAYTFLFKSFVRDVCSAQAKELALAAQRNSYPTTILFLPTRVKRVLPIQPITETQAISNFWRHMNIMGYQIANTASPQHKVLTCAINQAINEIDLGHIDFAIDYNTVTL